MGMHIRERLFSKSLRFTEYLTQYYVSGGRGERAGRTRFPLTDPFYGPDAAPSCTCPIEHTVRQLRV